LAQDFGFGLIVVAPNRIGVINQVLQTILAASFKDPGADGIVLADILPQGSDRSMQSNPAELARWTNVPLLARLPHGAAEFDTIVDWPALARPFTRRRKSRPKYRF